MKKVDAKRNRIQFSNESKFYLFKTYEQLNLMYVCTIMKHSNGKVLVRDYSPNQGISLIHDIEQIMYKEESGLCH